MSPPSTGKSLRTIDAARRLGFDDPEKFRLAAKRAGVVGQRQKNGHVFWSEADVDAVRESLPPPP